MKKLQITFAAMLFAIALFSCNYKDLPTNSGNEESANYNPKGSNITVNANPAIAYMGYLTVGKGSKAKLYFSIAIMDADGANATNLYYSTGLGYNPVFRHLTWSPNGSNICFTESDCKVLKLTVSLVNGVPTGTNVTTLVSYSSTTDYWVRNVAWSPSTSLSEIAFSRSETPGKQSDASLRRTSIMTISPNGGTASEIYYELGSSIVSLTWNYDGSKIAVLTRCLYGDNINVYTIKIINRSTGEVLSSYNMGTSDIRYISWSRAGSNKLCWTSETTSGANLYSFDLDQSNPSPVQVTLESGSYPRHPDWTSDNSKIIYGNYPAYGCKTVTLSNGTITTSSFTGLLGYPDWKR